MKLKIETLVCLIFAFGSNCCYSQSEWKPISKPLVTLDSVVIAKITLDTSGNQQLSLLIPKFQSESRTRTIEKTVCRTETRQRTVKLPDGRDGTEDYSVQIPSTVFQEVAYQIVTPKESERVNVGLATIKAWSIGGDNISINDLQRHLSSAKRVFLLPENAFGEYKFDPYYTGVLDSKTLVLAVPLPSPAPGPKKDIAPTSAPMRKP